MITLLGILFVGIHVLGLIGLVALHCLMAYALIAHVYYWFMGEDPAGRGWS